MQHLNCNVLTMMQYVHGLRNVHNQSTAICRQIICAGIKVEYFCDNILSLTDIGMCFSVNTMLEIWYGRMEDCLPFHS